MIRCIFPYELNSNILDYVDNERDLGVLVNETLIWHLQHNKLITKASQLLGLTKRTCHFVNNKNRRRSLYLALVRSQFEHCSPIWRPCSAIQIEKFEKIQKNAIKWILHEQYLSYNDHEVYHRKCTESNLLPLAQRFELNDVILFHKIVYSHVYIDMPSYIKMYTGNSRLRSTHLDCLSYVASLNSLNSSMHSQLYKSFVYRTIHIWNKLPFETRNYPQPQTFRLGY